jgi:hypothetical protein
MDLYRLAEERGFVIAEAEVDVRDGECRPGWLVYDLATGEFVPDAVNWTMSGQVKAYIEEASG